MEESSEAFLAWREQLTQLIPKLSYESVIELAYYLAFEAKLNDRLVWRLVENAALENYHFYELKHICQLEWAVTQLKPKVTSARFDNMLLKSASDQIDKGLQSSDDFHHIM